MKSDIKIPEVENVFFAAVQEWSDDFMENIWNVYLVNDSDFDLDSVMVVSCGVTGGFSAHPDALKIVKPMVKVAIYAVNRIQVQPYRQHFSTHQETLHSVLVFQS